MTQHYYLIYFDTETKEWVHDVDSEDIRLDGMTIWNTNTEEWQSGYIGDGQWVSEQEHIDEIMKDGLAFLNRISAIKGIEKDKNEN